MNCVFFMSPLRYSIAQTPGLVIPSPGYAAESSEEQVMKACICGHMARTCVGEYLLSLMCLRISQSCRVPYGSYQPK